MFVKANIGTNLLRECCDWQYLLVFMVEVEVVGVEDQGFRRGTGEVRQDDSATKISRVVLKIGPSLNYQLSCAKLPSCPEPGCEGSSR